jgi:Kef-type K+ transport system membrane component KefB
MLLVAGLALAVLAEKLGLHFILGAFFAGLFFGRQTIDKESYESVMQQVSGLTTGFLAPIFFASIGLHLDLSALWEIPGFVALLILIACVGKIFGAGICARFTGMNTQESFAVGIGMNGRGAVELIIADIALRAGILSQPVPIPPIINYMFSAVVIMAVVTTLMTPPILKVTLNK